MRAWFWTLLLATLAVALAVVLRDHSGNVLILVPPWRIELSLTLAVLLGLGLVILVHGVLRLLSWFSRSPQRVRAWRALRAVERDNALLESSWISVLEERGEQTCKDLSALLARARTPQRKALLALALARTQHDSGHYAERDVTLKTAQSAARTPRLQAVVAIAGASLLLDQGQAQEALALLQPLRDAATREPAALRLLLRVHRQLGHHEQVYALTRLLWRRGVLDKAQALKEIETSAAARLAQCDAQGFKTLWGSLKSEEKTLPAVALQAALTAQSQGNAADAARMLETAISASTVLDARLLIAYAQCPPEDVAHRLQRAEGWLKAHPENPDLLAMLGALCFVGQLWGQGERYLLRSLRLRPDPRVIALLGNLYERIGRFEDAARQWRLAANTGLPALTLAENYVLPAADMRADPSALDFASAQEDLFGESFGDSVSPPSALKEKHES